MSKKIIFCAFPLIFLFSCNAEKVNLSPISDLDGTDRYRNTSFTERADQINYASEITNLISTLPKFRNDAVNAEARKLKTSLHQYIDDIQDYNPKKQAAAFAHYEDSYKKLQKLKSYLTTDESEVLNRYLVRIKTNMNILDEQQKKKSVTINE